MAINTKISQDHIYDSKAFKSFSTSRQPRVKLGSYELLEPSSSPIPKEIWCNVFRFLSPKDLYCGAALTCRRCYIVSQWDCLLLGFSLDQLFPSLRIIGPEVWEKKVDLKKFGLDVTDAPNYDTLEVRRQLIQLYAPGVMLEHLWIQGNPGATILTIPKGLSRANLCKIFEDTYVDYYENDYYENYGQDTSLDKTVEHTYNVIFTNNYLANPQQGLKPGEKFKTSSELECAIPDLTSALTFVTLTLNFYHRTPFTHRSIINAICPTEFFCEVYDIDKGKRYIGLYEGGRSVQVLNAWRHDSRGDDIIAMCKCGEPKSINPEKPQ
jgi:F-box domain